MTRVTLLRIWKSPLLYQLIIVVLVVIILLQQRSCKSFKDDIHAFVLKDSTSHYTDRNGRIHGQTKDVEVTAATAGVVYKEQLSAKAKELRVKPKHITSITSVISERRLNVDSLTRLYQDTIRTTDSLYITLRDSLSITQYRKRQGLFKRIPMIDVVNYSGGTSIKAVEGFRIKDNQSNLNFGPVISVGIQNGKLTPQVGIGLQYKIFGFRLGR